MKKAVDQRVAPTRRRGSQSCIEVEDVPVLAMLGLLGKMRLSPSDKRTVRRWLRSPDPSSELESRALRVSHPRGRDTRAE